MKLSIRWVIITGFLGLIWGTQLIITSSSYITSERVLLKHAKSIMTNIIELTMEQSQNHLGLAQGAAHLTKRLISSNVVSSDLNQQKTLEKYFIDQLVIYPHFAGIYYGTPSGNFFYVSRSDKKVKNGLRTKIILNENGIKTTQLIWRNENLQEISREVVANDSYDPRTRPWYTKAANENNIVWTDPYIFFTSKKPGITIAGPAKSDDGPLKGVVGVDIDIEQLSIFISKLEIGISGKAFMFNNNGDVVAFHDISQIVDNTNKSSSRLVNIKEINDPVIRKAFSSIKWEYSDNKRINLTDSCFGTFFHENKKFNVMFSPFSNKQWPWIIGVYLPEDDYLGRLKGNRQTNVFITIIISIIATIIALLLSRSLLKPIANLEKEAQAIGNFDMLTHFDTKSGYSEIQCMSDAFNQMKNRLNKHEHEKSRLENQLIRSERLAATGQLAASIANEINSPLQAILLLLNTMELKHQRDTSLLEDLETIKQVFETIEARIDSFQDLNKPRMAERVPSNLNDIIEATINLMRMNFSKSLIKVNLDFDPKLPEINIAFLHFAQIFLNVVNNSIESISKHSNIDISAIDENARLPLAGTINIRTGFDNSEISATITDTGPGFSEDILPVLFDLFSTKRKTIDIGIGLSICKGLLTEYNGSIKAGNLSEGGAEIVIKIPVSLNTENG